MSSYIGGSKCFEVVTNESLRGHSESLNLWDEIA
jgi:hypothetical protein